MARKISPFKLGLFIIFCGTIGLIAIIWLGASHYFEKKQVFVSYFEESVKGLQKDAVVNYLGVPVGRVASLGLAPDGRLIEVVMYLKPEFKVVHPLVIRLLEQGLTGLRYLEINAAPADSAVMTPAITFPVPYPIIPSYPSEISQLKMGLESLYAKIIQVDLEGLAERWKKTAELLNNLLVDSDISAILHSVQATSGQLQQLAVKLNELTPKDKMKRGTEDLAETLAATRKTSELLVKQLEGLPPGGFAQVLKRFDRMLEAGASTISGWHDESDRVFGALAVNLDQTRQVLNELRHLVNSMREQPQRILLQPKTPDPFSQTKN
jgi:phospholipid/cholesterol/gamma-HCH transport system substrate-binding protein